MRELFGDERGQALFETALFLPLLVALIGLVVDGGLLFANYRRAQIAADTAAHAASHQVDVDVFVDSNQVVLDSNEALQAALDYGGYNSHGQLTISEVRVAPREVRVVGTASLPTAFLRLAGIPQVHVRVVGEAYPAYGIEYEWQ